MQAEAGPSRSSGPASKAQQDTPCRYFYRSGRCKRGDKCLFSHQRQRKGEPSDSAPSSSLKQSRTTPLSAQAPDFTPRSAPQSQLSAGAEPFEPSSQGSGDEDAWQDVDPAPASPIKPRAGPMKGVPASVSENTEPCGICMEIPEVYAHHPNCDHSFCPSCLREWRRQHAQAKNKNCPTCRTSSKFTFVTPQPFTSGARILALQRFKERAATTPCKIFTKSLALSNKRTKPFCVFGDDCLYQHHINGQPYKFGVGRYRIAHYRKGTKRLVRPSARTERTIGAEFFDRIRDMDERVRMFLATRVLVNARVAQSTGETHLE